MVERLETQLVFENTSNNSESQISVKKQLLTTIIHMVNYGNTASFTKIRDLSKIEKGIMDKVCRKVIIIIQYSKLQNVHIK